jgi:protein phosphatase
MIGAMPVISIADPSLVVLVGAAGAGKSTFAARHFARDEILSSDAFRALVGRGEDDQAATRAAFSALHRGATRRLSTGLVAVVDATNVERHARATLVRRARAARVPAFAIVLDLPPGIVAGRNARRAGRTVEPGVVRRHLAMLRRMADRGLLDDERFDAVYWIREPAEVDAATVVRRRDRQPAAPAPLGSGGAAKR